MARKAGLPDSFDLKVSREELVHGPARLPGYLDRTGTRFAEIVEEEVAASEKVIGPKVVEPPQVTPPASKVVVAA